MKECSKCKVLKPRSEFHKNRSSKDGLQGECKTCQKAAGLEYQKRNREANAGREIDLAGTKECSMCKVLKQRADFHKNRGRKDGLRGECKECSVEQHAKRQRKKCGDDWIPYQSCGFKPQETAVFYVVRVRNKISLRESLKIGITNSDAESRFLCDKRYEVLEIHLEINGSGYACQALERAALRVASERGWRARSTTSDQELEQMRESVNLGSVFELIAECEELRGIACPVSIVTSSPEPV